MFNNRSSYYFIFLIKTQIFNLTVICSLQQIIVIILLQNVIQETAFNKRIQCSDNMPYLNLVYLGKIYAEKN